MGPGAGAAEPGAGPGRPESVTGPVVGIDGGGSRTRAVLTKRGEKPTRELRHGEWITSARSKLKLNPFSNAKFVLLGWRTATASGIAVQTTGAAPDPNAGQGPEAPLPETPPASPPAEETETIPKT